MAKIPPKVFREFGSFVKIWCGFAKREAAKCCGGGMAAWVTVWGGQLEGRAAATLTCRMVGACLVLARIKSLMKPYLRIGASHLERRVEKCVVHSALAPSRLFVFTIFCAG